MMSCDLLIQCDIFSHLQTFLLANALLSFYFHMNANASGDQLFSTYEGKGGEGVIETHAFAYKGKKNFSLMYICEILHDHFVTQTKIKVAGEISL